MREHLYKGNSRLPGQWGQVNPYFLQHNGINWSFSPGNPSSTLKYLNPSTAHADTGFFRHLLNMQKRPKYVPVGNFPHTGGAGLFKTLHYTILIKHRIKIQF